MSKHRLKIIIKSILPIIVVVIGCVEIVGATKLLPSQLRIVQILFSSPNPSVFYHPEISASIHFDAMYKNGDHKSAVVAPGAFDKLPGPLSMRQSFAIAVFGAVSDEAVESIYRFGACKDEAAYLSPLLDSTEPIEMLRVRINYPALVNLPERDFVVSCR